METSAPELIPGLPDCLARECLLRLPFHALRVARNVSKKWKEEITSASFYRLRKAAGFACPVVAVLLIGGLPPSLASDDDDDDDDEEINAFLFPSYIKVALFEPLTGVWTEVPAILGRACYPISCCYMAAVGHELVLIIDCDSRVTKLNAEVHVYNMIAGTWRQGKSMPPLLRRYGAAYASGLGAVFLAGGYDLRNRCLNSALSYDVAADEWALLPNMSRPLGRRSCEGMFANGAFRVLETRPYQNGLWSADEFDVEAGHWKKSERKIESAFCMAAAEGREYMCRDGGPRKLEVLEFVGGGGGDGGAGKVLDTHGGTVDGWQRIGVLPCDGLRPMYMMAWDGGIMVCHWQASFVLEIGGGATATAAAPEKNKWKRIEWSDDLNYKQFPCIFLLKLMC
ncbi:F-box/kelch-repeat protein At1g15670-like [Curcuma longa]|uniref:F-box/kelch-repeat protein At1g15670-like n=1 Tax=Curcuma longa TaxID=136217 RepID=UPI003D9F1C36